MDLIRMVILSRQKLIGIVYTIIRVNNRYLNPKFDDGESLTYCVFKHYSYGFMRDQAWLLSLSLRSCTMFLLFCGC